MRPLSFIVISCLIVFTNCGKEEKMKLISSAGNKAESVYLTHDDKDNPVVAWTEVDNNNKLTLHFSMSYDNGKSFSERKSLPLSGDVATHAEGMPKVAFKKDGTIIAAYEKKIPTKENKYAGAIYYSISKDNGKSWTRETFLHSDTVAGRSRSYFDIERLSDGEVGASWLDINLDNDTGGRSVRFAKTQNDKGFTNEILVDSSACQCCRIDVYSDIAGQINIAYRGMMKGKMGKLVRDMMIATSNNNGKSFTAPLRISQDNWAIDGCPHTGPSLCSNKSGLYSIWYTEGNGTGIYYSFKDNKDIAFPERQLISNTGHHPQMSANTSRFAMVWEENSNNEKHETKIFYQVNEGKKIIKAALNPDDSNAFLPVITQTRDGFLIAFLMETEGAVGMYTTKLD
jgi:hypothetical protein